MAKRTLFALFDTQTLSPTEPGAEKTSATGWTVGTNTEPYKEMRTGEERGNTGWGGAALPSANPEVTNTKDTLWSTEKITGEFKAEAWKLALKVIAVTAGGTQDGVARVRLWKSPTKEGSFTALTAALSLSEVVNLTTEAAQVTEGNLEPGVVKLENEYLGIQIAWKITGAGAGATNDVLFREGPAIKLVSAEEATAGKTVEFKASISSTSSLSANLIRTRLFKAALSSASSITAALTVVKAASTAFKPSRKPPLGLDWEVETAEGAVFHLSEQAKKARNRPSGSGGGCQRGEGFAGGNLTFNREIFKDYPDIGLMDTWRHVGRQGDIAYEGRLQSAPRTNDPSQIISPSLVGWATYLKSRQMPALIIDRRLGSWIESSVVRKASLAPSWTYGSFSASPDSTTGIPGLSMQVAQVPFTAPRIEAWFDAGNGQTVASILIKPTLQSFGLPDASLTMALGAASDDVATGYSANDLKASNGVRTLVDFPTPGEFVLLELAWASTAGGTAGKTYGAQFQELAAIGSHGLTLRGEEGFYVSDIIQYILATYYPKIQWAGEQNTFTLTQATWHDNPTLGFEAIQQMNNLVLWETNIWEERKFYFEPADLTQADWQIRTTDPGVTVNFQGDSIENVANGVPVVYTDFSGNTRTLWPDEHEELRDESEDNPANRHGENLWAPSVTVPWQCVEAEALQFGRAYLAEYLRPKRPGSFTVKGHIKDAAGHWHQYWKPRNSETIMVSDDGSETEPRLITAVSYDEESLTSTITVDAPPSTLDAIVARNELALQARNLS